MPMQFGRFFRVALIRLTRETVASPDPLWMEQLEWPLIIRELGLGHPMKFIWAERAKTLITYPNFWRQFYRKFPQYREATITAREFEPGERVEVNYAGDPIEWYEITTGDIETAHQKDDTRLQATHAGR
jgi:hypothetical protein